jgi:hypothetical protein
MEGQAEQHAVPAEELSAPTSLKGSGQNGVDNNGHSNPPATVSEAFAALETDEHPRGDEVRKQVGYNPHCRYQSDFA